MAVREVIIIGAGPAGLATAIQLRRFGIDPVVFERQSAGGLLRNANLVENYPGFPDGIAGVELVRLFEKQAYQVGVRITFEEVEKLDYNGGLFKVESAGSQLACRVAVVASGTKARQFPYLEISPAARDKVFYEVYTLLEISNRRILIVGAGDAAFDYALNLAVDNQVVIINRGQTLKCLPLLWERALANDNIRYQANIQLQRVDAAQNGLLISAVGPQGKLRYEADYLIGAIGRRPVLDFLSARLKDRQERLVDDGALYMIGDVTKGIYRQTAIAVGEGILTAMKIHWSGKELDL
jgi:thioredoxin reductase